MAKHAKGTGYQTYTRQMVNRDFRLVLRRDRQWPRATRVIAVSADGIEVPLVRFTREGTLRREKNVYLEGITTDSDYRIKLDEPN